MWMWQPITTVTYHMNDFDLRGTNAALREQVEMDSTLDENCYSSHLAMAYDWLNQIVVLGGLSSGALLHISSVKRSIREYYSRNMPRDWTLKILLNDLTILEDLCHPEMPHNSPQQDISLPEASVTTSRPHLLCG
jgi:hypothetical protein